MKKRELYNLGIPRGEAMQQAIETVRNASKAGERKSRIRAAKEKRIGMFSFEDEQ